jgi:hypothetical protein
MKTNNIEINRETVKAQQPTFSRRWLLRVSALVATEILVTSGSIAQGDPSSKTAQQQLRAAYEAHFKDYRAKRDAFETEIAKYWQKIRTQQIVRRTKRAANVPVLETDYVLDQPPEYTGPSEPKMPAFMKGEKPGAGTTLQEAAASHKTPVVQDFLAAAKTHYGFVPRVTGEKNYMLAFAREALAAGFKAEQVVGVYGLETGGIGPYSRQSGVITTDNQCQPTPAHGSPASSLALGYVQLLPANTVSEALEHAPAITERLIAVAEKAPQTRAAELRAKAATFGKMIDHVKKWTETYTGAKDNWQEYVVYGRTAKGLAMHSLLLDADIGPWLQVYKLLGIKERAARRGLGDLSSAELELINLVGDGRGAEALTPAAKNAASANFFDRGGYEGNPVAKRLSASSLLAKIREVIERRKRECGSKWFFEAFDAVERERAEMLHHGPRSALMRRSS